MPDLERMTRIERTRARRLSLCAALLAILSLIAAACGADSGDPAPTATVTDVPATATPAGPTATPTPDLAVLLKDGGIAVVEAAYNRLLDEYIDPLDPATLMTEAWGGVQSEAQAQGVVAPGTPAIAGERTDAFAAFRGAWTPFVGAMEEKTAAKYRAAAIRAMTTPLNDCHTFFLNPVASETLTDSRSGKGVVGIGIELIGSPPLVTEVITGGPAADAGITVGDRITAVDGTATQGKGPASTFDLINGDEGTSVSLQVQHPTGTTDTLAITRERVTPPNVESRVIDGRLGYVRVRNFVDGGIAAQLKTALDSFEASNLSGWIVDLRGNPGGRLDTQAASLWIADGVVVRDRGRDGKSDTFEADPSFTLPNLRPTVVLANDRTGSVAEVFAASLQEYGKAFVIGGTTNGCVGFTDIQPLGDGSSLAVTTHVNQGPISLKELNGAGVTPDLAVARTEADIANLRDPQLDAAIAHLSQ
jgi:carboxyl-terminal processing protease